MKASEPSGRPAPGKQILMTGGTSSARIYQTVLSAFESSECPRGLAIDVGCGRGDFSQLLKERFRQVIGIDTHPFDGCWDAPGLSFQQADLNREAPACLLGEADACFAVEVIEHLENPRQFMRTLASLLKPGGWCFVSTPNQLSLSSKLCLVVRDCFRDFQDSCYPAHITALVAADLERICNEVGFVSPVVQYTNSGRLPGSAWYWQNILPLRGKWFSDNVVVMARLPVATAQP